MTDLPAGAVAPATALMWPQYAGPGDIESIEQVPLERRRLPASTYHALRESALADPSRTAALFIPDGARWASPRPLTYGELLDQVHRVANVLTVLGLGRKDAVGLLSPNVAGFVPAVLGAQAAGIAAPVNPALSADHVTELLRRAGARILIAAGPEISPETWELARHVAANLKLDALLALRPTQPEDDAASLGSINGVSIGYLDDLARRQNKDRLLGSEPQSHDLAAFFHTGGTTGTPKLAAHTHRMEVVDAWAIAAAAPMNRDSTLFAALPLFHVNALVVTTLAPILRGSRAVWAGPFGYRDPALMQSFWRILERYRITGMSAVPSVYATLSRIPIDADISALQLPLVGAAPLPRSVRDAWFAHTGIPLCEGYGLTEATCASARNFPGFPRPESVGQRLPYQHLAAVDIDEATGEWTFLPPGTVGTIAIHGPTVFPGYVVGRTAGGPVLDPAGKIRAGWLDTGDLGSVSADGFVTLTGRAKDVIIRGGHNIDPAVVETLLLQHPDVLDASVVGRPDQYAGEVPVAFVVVRERNANPGQILQWIAERMSEKASIPKDITVLPALPHTAIGKQYKLGLRILATRQELEQQLAELGYAVPPGEDWCVQRGGRITVRLPAPTDAAQRAAVTRLLDHYAFTWELV